MENQSQLCGFCTTPYDNSDQTPRILINCGHTLCSYCLGKILKTPLKSRKCPLDHIAFSRSQNSIDKFPPNFALLALLEGKKQNTCQVHDKKLKIFCLQDQVKICSDCALFGEHNGHNIKKVKELKAKGVKVKKDLEEVLMNFKKNPFEKTRDVETLKKRCLGQMETKLGEINEILKSKKQEWKKQMDNLFERNTDNINGASSKKEAEKALEEIDQATQKEENLALLDRDFSSILSRLQSQEEISKLADESSKMMNCIESCLADQAKSIKQKFEDFDLLNQRIGPEQPISKEDDVIEIKRPSVSFKSPFSFEINGTFLSISAKNLNPKNQMINLPEIKKITKIKVELERYGSLFQDPNYITSLSEILEKFNNCTSLMLFFHPEGLTDDRALNIFKVVFPKIQQLTEIKIFLRNCKITNEPLLYFCETILTKATSLKYFTLKLDSISINDLCLFALAKSLSPFSRNLRALRLGVDHTSVTDDGINKIFNVIEGVKELNLYFVGTKITDKSLKMLGDYMMPLMKNLKKFKLDGSHTEITIEGVNAIFEGVPKDIIELVLVFKGINLPDTIVSLFEEKVCPKLKMVEDVDLWLEGRDLAAKISKVLNAVRKQAAKKGLSIKKREMIVVE